MKKVNCPRGNRKVVNTTVTSAANILTKFAQYQYRLIEVQNRGKYRYYSLTSLAIEYIEYINGQQKKRLRNKLYIILN